MYWISCRSYILNNMSSTIPGLDLSMNTLKFKWKVFFICPSSSHSPPQFTHKCTLTFITYIYDINLNNPVGCHQGATRMSCQIWSTGTRVFLQRRKSLRQDCRNDKGTHTPIGLCHRLEKGEGPIVCCLSGCPAPSRFKFRGLWDKMAGRSQDI